ncbi:MAG: Non-canonical purine NTP pyrophosphatase [Alphaproteobacteria bacterium MarineAlpha9_Bin4]|nr:non-canonical purine NTP pyrophosphatase, RdgB/HAM1 family [Pelagibacterales bacterium]PPR25579.1 MAG: Non-canonical purine NTP pyrophosphatase [Alphaproteobacteria bacterium MarineAlpha9_Bin4]|tara:strand:- start:299 stop:904 length:606 start_codon:yes stop_codon:yes gene_type:complete
MGKNIKIILATHNKKKVIEFNKIFKLYNITFLPLTIFTQKQPKETGKSFRENAIIKAKNAGKVSGWKLPCLADDSGLSIKILSNQPGIYSARWAEKKDYSQVFKIIYDKIKDKGAIMEGQRAFFTCCLALLYSPTKIYIFKGILEGNLTYPPRGRFGFGYDPIFIPNGNKKTLAEISSNEKNKISHRRLAISKLIEHAIDK